MIPLAIIAAAVVVIALNDSQLMAAPAGGVAGMIQRAAELAGVDPAVMLAICRRESNFNPSAVNPSDPSYGLFMVQPMWLSFFGYGAGTSQLLDPNFNAAIACQIVSYFQGRGFSFPSQADIYNVGETLWRKGVRNVAYRDAVTGFYRSFQT